MALAVGGGSLVIALSSAGHTAAPARGPGSRSGAWERRPSRGTPRIPTSSTTTAPTTPSRPARSDGNNLQALVDTTGGPAGGWRPYTGGFGSTALADPPAWQQPGTQTSPGVFYYGGHWVMWYDASRRATRSTVGFTCLAVATAASLTPSDPRFTDTSGASPWCPPGGVLDPSPFVDPTTGVAYLVWKTNDGTTPAPRRSGRSDSTRRGPCSPRRPLAPVHRHRGRAHHRRSASSSSRVAPTSCSSREGTSRTAVRRAVGRLRGPADPVPIRRDPSSRRPVPPTVPGAAVCSRTPAELVARPSPPGTCRARTAPRTAEPTGNSSSYPTDLPPSPPPIQYTGMAALPDGQGYWLVDSTGAVSPHGAAVSYGSMAGRAAQRTHRAHRAHPGRQGVLAGRRRRRRRSPSATPASTGRWVDAPDRARWSTSPPPRTARVLAGRLGRRGVRLR